MRLIKGVVIYTGIVFISALMIGILLLASMWMFGFKVAGYNFLYRAEQGSEITRYTVSNIKSIKNINLDINVEGYNVIIEPTNASKVDYITVQVVDDYIGFLKTADGQNEFNSIPECQYVSVTGDTANFTINQPVMKGAFLSRNSRMIINLPHGDDIAYNVDISSKSGNVDIRNAVDTTTNEFLYGINVKGIVARTDNGSVTVKGLGAPSLGKTVETKSDYTLESFNFNTKGGNFDFTQFKNLTVKKHMYVQADRAEFNFNSITCQSGMTLIGDEIRLISKIVNVGDTGFNYKTDKGVIDIDILNASTDVYSFDADGKVNVITNTVEESELNTYKLDVYTNKIYTNSAPITIDYVVGQNDITNKYADIKLGNVANTSYIINDVGNVSIDCMGKYKFVSTAFFAENSAVVVNTVNGNIKVNELYQNAVLTTDKGDITANHKNEFAADGNNDVQNNFGKSKLVTLTDNGNINVTTKFNAIESKSIDGTNIYVTIYAIYDVNNDNNPEFKIDNKKGKTTFTAKDSANINVYVTGNISGQIGVYGPNSANAASKIVANQDNYLNDASATNHAPKINLLGGDVVLKSII